MNVHENGGRVLTFSRRFDAPRDVVFSLWTHPRHKIRWFGPRAHSLSVCEQDFRVGGGWRVCIVNAENGDKTWVWGTYREIAEPETLVFSYSMHWHQYETLVSIRFEDLGEATLMHFRQAEFGNDSDLADHGWGWHSALDCMADYILNLKSLHLLHPDLYDREPRDGVAEDFAEAAARAKDEAERAKVEMKTA